MPYKFNEGRRHKIPKAKYRVTNWPEYDCALVRRGSLTFWITEEAVEAWHAPATGERGAQPVYSPIAIETRQRPGLSTDKRGHSCRRLPRRLRATSSGLA